MCDRYDRLRKSLHDWYRSNPQYLETVLGIIRRENSKVSLRAIEYFVTGYAHKYKILLKDQSNPTNVIDVYWAYKEALKTFHKTLFDPFCRSTMYTKVPTPFTPAKGFVGKMGIVREEIPAMPVNALENRDKKGGGCKKTGRRPSAKMPCLR